MKRSAAPLEGKRSGASAGGDDGGALRSLPSASSWYQSVIPQSEHDGFSPSASGCSSPAHGAAAAAHTADESDVFEATEDGASTASPLPSDTDKRVVLINLGAAAPLSKSDVMRWFWVLSQYGVVDRIRPFVKHRRVQLFVQYKNNVHAQSCYEGLNGTSIDSFTPTAILSDKGEVALEHCVDFTATNQAIEAQALKSPFEKLWLIHRSDNFGSVGDCVHISGLLGVKRKAGPENKRFTISLKMLWRIAAQYGNLVAAKLLGQGTTGCALLQFEGEPAADLFRRSIHQKRMMMRGKEFFILVCKSGKQHCGNWADTCKQTTLVAKTTPPPRPLPFSPSAPSRFVACVTEGGSEAGLRKCLTSGRLPACQHLHASSHPCVFTAEYATAGDACLVVSFLNGAQGVVLGFVEVPVGPFNPSFLPTAVSAAAPTLRPAEDSSAAALVPVPSSSPHTTTPHQQFTMVPQGAQALLTPAAAVQPMHPTQTIYYVQNLPPPPSVVYMAPAAMPIQRIPAQPSLPTALFVAGDNQSLQMTSMVIYQPQ